MADNLDDILYHLGEQHDEYFGATSPPLIQSSNFQFPDIDSFRHAILHEHSAHVYTKGNNPTVEILRKKLAALEGTEDALVVSSGTAAVAMAVMSQVNQGDHIVCVRNPYSWTQALMSQYLPRFGVNTTFVDGRDIHIIRQAITPETKVLYLESPNTLTFELQDLEACAHAAKDFGLVSMIDNSCATPLYQNPARFGIDIVIHSMSKYLNGHSDVMAGAIMGSNKHINKVFYGEYMTLGPAVSPFDAWLMIRGLRTLSMRMERISNTTSRVLEFLKRHDLVERTIYPFDPDFPQYELACRQMKKGTGLITFSLSAPDKSAILRFADSLRRFKIAVSWGGPESLILPSAALYGLEGREDPPVPWNVVRLSIGLESPESLVEDLSQALDQFRH